MLVQESPLGSYSIAPRFLRGSSGFFRGRPRFRGTPESGLETGNRLETGNGPDIDLSIIDGCSEALLKVTSPEKLAVLTAGLIGIFRLVAGLILRDLGENVSTGDFWDMTFERLTSCS